MTTEPMRPGRITGLALLGVSAVATVLGVVTLVGGGGNGEAAQPTDPPAATSAPGGEPGSTEPPAATTTDPVTTTEAPAATTTTTPPPVTTTTTQAPPNPQEPPGTPSVKDGQEVRVYNNSFVAGMADRAAADLRAAGWNVVESSNYNGGNIPVPTVYYRPGTSEEAAARALAGEFGIRVEPRFEGIADSSPGIIVIVTKDYAGVGAAAAGNPGNPGDK